MAAKFQRRPRKIAGGIRAACGRGPCAVSFLLNLVCGLAEPIGGQFAHDVTGERLASAWSARARWSPKASRFRKSR